MINVHSPLVFWFGLFVLAVMLAVFTVMQIAERLRTAAEDEEYRNYFKRLDETDKASHSGL